MRATILCLFVLSSVAWQSPARASPESIAPERARVLLAEALDAQVQASARFRYQSRIRVTPKTAPARQRDLTWLVDGNPFRGNIRCSLKDSDGDASSLSIRRDGLFYYVSHQADNARWTSWVDVADKHRFEELDPLQWHYFPVSKDPLGTVMSMYRIVEASASPGELAVVCAIAPDLAESVAIDRPVTGTVGWRFQFEDVLGAWRLTVIDRLQTARVATGTRGREVVWESNVHGLPGVEERVVLEKLRCVVEARTVFSEFRRVGSVVIPLEVTQHDSQGLIESRILPETLAEATDASQSEWQFAPPPGFGPVGVHTDLRNGRSEFVGPPGSNEDSAMVSMIRRGRDFESGLAADQGGQSGGGVVLAAAVVVVALGCVAVALWLRRRGPTG